MRITASIFQTKGYICVDRSARRGRQLRAVRKVQIFRRVSAKNSRTNLTSFSAFGFRRIAHERHARADQSNLHPAVFVLGGGWEIAKPAIRILHPANKFGSNSSRGGFTAARKLTIRLFRRRSEQKHENLNRIQRVPAQTLVFSSHAHRVLTQDQTFILGFDLRETRGASDEIGLANNTVTTLSGAGGRERTVAVFLQDFLRVGSKFVLAGSLRYDDWTNARAYSSTRSLANNQTTTVNFPDRYESAISPQISALYQANRNLSFFALASKSFRAPTLNELYRGFRVGSVVTLANENLKVKSGEF